MGHFSRFLITPTRIGRPRLPHRLQFETLEVREVLSANAPTVDPAALSAAVDAARIDMTVSPGRTVTNAFGVVADLPANATFVDEWDIVTVELWTAIPSSEQGIVSAAVDMAFDAAYLEPIAIDYAPAFTADVPAGDLPSEGPISLAGSTSALNLGTTGYLQFATVEFRVLSVPIDIDQRLIGPIDMGFDLSNVALETQANGAIVPDIGAMPESELWAMLYDFDGDNRVNFSELAIFTEFFLNVVDQTPDDTAWWADFNKSGRVEFADLAVFTANFLRVGPHADVAYPNNFPEAWRKTPIDPTSGFSAPLAAPLFAAEAEPGIDLPADADIAVQTFFWPTTSEPTAESDGQLAASTSDQTVSPPPLAVSMKAMPNEVVTIDATPNATAGATDDTAAEEDAAAANDLIDAGVLAVDTLLSDWP
ncbi:MAG: hypothetical protein KDA42_14550 [Planctomycetales bacterium]|nr:hypothetical protein [Planctomycetales bacterium]